MVALRINPADVLPLHHQLQQQLRAAIRDGELRPGDMLPPELQITRETGLSRTTVRRAMDDLVHEGLIVRERGRGTFVAAPPSPKLEGGRFVVFAPPLDVPRRSTRLLGMALTPPETPIDRQLHLGEGPSLQIARLLRCGDAPCAVERLALPPLPWDAAQEAALSDAKLLELTERVLGLRITHAKLRIVPVMLDEATARTLDTRAAVPGLLAERHVYAGQRVIEHRRMIVHGSTAGVEIATAREILLA